MSLIWEDNGGLGRYFTTTYINAITTCDASIKPYGYEEQLSAANSFFFFKNGVAPIFYIARLTFTDVHNDIGGTSQTKQCVGKHLGYSSKAITVTSKAHSKAHDTTAQYETISS